jgi:subtilisin family serine protease
MRRFIGILLLAATPSLAFEQVDIQSINAWAAQKSLGTGKGVKIAVLDQGIDITHPAIRGSVYAERDFTGQKFTHDDNGPVGHGTGIASILVGHDKSVYRGIAPDALLLNARVVNSRDVSTNRSAGDGLVWAAKSGAKVINMSFGNKFDEGPLTYKFNLMVDYIAEKYGATDSRGCVQPDHRGRAPDARLQPRRRLLQLRTRQR